jgi:hypothetical protein
LFVGYLCWLYVFIEEEEVVCKKKPDKKFIGPALDEKLTSAVLNNKRTNNGIIVT